MSFHDIRADGGGYHAQLDLGEGQPGVGGADRKITAADQPDTAAHGTLYPGDSGLGRKFRVFISRASSPPIGQVFLVGVAAHAAHM